MKPMTARAARSNESREDSRAAVIRVVREALVQSGHPSPPDAWVTAIADGASPPGPETLPTEPCLDLVLFDTDAIGGYVFESNRPPVVAGASKILRELNCEIAQGDHELARWVVFSGGGEGLLLAPRGQGERLCKRIEDLYQERTGGALGVTTALLAVAPSMFVPPQEVPTSGAGDLPLLAGTQAVLARLRDRVRCKKDARLPARPEVDGGARRCASCRDREGTLEIPARRDDEPDARLCRPCHRRWQEGRPEIDAMSFEEVIRPVASLLDAAGQRGQYLGFLYLDGNAMGKLFSAVPDLAGLRFLSHTVGWVFGEVRHRTEARVGKLLQLGSGDRRPMVSLLGGGDEAIFLLPGALAVDVAVQVQHWIAEATRNQTGLTEMLSEHERHAITVGMGLVLCQVKFPVRYQFELAKALQKNAKRLSYAAETPVSAIDFELLTDSSPLSDEPEEARKVAFATDEPGFFATCRPFELERFVELHRLCKETARYGVARSQLYPLRATAREGQAVFLNLLRYQIARKASGKSYREWLTAHNVSLADREAIERFFVWQRGQAGGTWIGDLLDLAPFVDTVHSLEDRHDAAA